MEKRKLDDQDLNEIFKDNIGKGWYGFEYPHLPDHEHYQLIKDAVTAMVKLDPNVVLQQIKQKWGTQRIYLESKVEIVNTLATRIEKVIDTLNYAKRKGDNS